MKNSKVLMSVAVAGLLLGAQAALAQEAAKPAAEEGKNGCGSNGCGANGCKGKKEEKKKAGNSCGGANACSGPNGCDGKTEAAKPATP
jgi:hypothetical protein